MTEGERVVLFEPLLATFQFSRHEFVECAGNEGLIGHPFLGRPLLQVVQVAGRDPNVDSLVLLKELAGRLFQLTLSVFEVVDARQFPAFKVLKDLYFFPV